ncbi:MAG: CHAD domain-containing protein [Cognaticolwellia sp.]|jgi:CHAD domain-containing protein
MLQDGIYSFYTKQQMKLQRELETYEALPNEESLRQMRLCVKKMRVVFRLLERLTDGGIVAKVQLTEIRSVFKSAGNIRDFQLQLSLLNSYQIELKLGYSEYLAYLNREIHVYSNVFKADNIIISNSQLVENQILIKHFILVELSELDILNRIYAFLRKRLKKIKKAVKIGEEEALHQIRIWYKEVHYLLSLLNKHHFQSEKLKLELKEIKNFGRKIGAWHDLTVFRDSFNHYMDKYPTLRYKVEYQILQSRINIDAENGMRKVYQVLSDSVVRRLGEMTKSTI